MSFQEPWRATVSPDLEYGRTWPRACFWPQVHYQEGRDVQCVPTVRHSPLTLSTYPVLSFSAIASCTLVAALQGHSYHYPHLTDKAIGSDRLKAHYLHSQ